MLLKYLINTKPTIMLFFIVFCIVFSCIPMLYAEFNLLYSSSTIPSILVFIMAFIVPSFHAVGLNNLVFDSIFTKNGNQKTKPSERFQIFRNYKKDMLGVLSGGCLENILNSWT